MHEPLLDGPAQTARDRGEPLLRAGNSNCGGCGMSVGFQMLSRAAGDLPLKLVIPACCAMAAAGPFPYSAFGAPTVGAVFASTAAVGAGMARAAQMNGEATRVVCWAGDGGTYDIGMATLSAAAERDEDLLYLCYDNEVYGNTGGQRSSATPLGAGTTTTPDGNPTPKKDILGIMAAHGIPYAATLSLAHPDDMLRKLRHALTTRGFRFLHMLSPCPTCWKSEPSLGIELVRLAVRSGIYAVYEVFDGTRTVINVEPDFSADALARYLKAQGRFRHAEGALEAVRADVERSFRRLRLRAKVSDE